MIFYFNNFLYFLINKYKDIILYILNLLMGIGDWAQSPIKIPK